MGSALGYTLVQCRQLVISPRRLLLGGVGHAHLCVSVCVCKRGVRAAWEEAWRQQANSKTMLELWLEDTEGRVTTHLWPTVVQHTAAHARYVTHALR